MNKPELIIFDLGRVLVDFDFKKVIKDWALKDALMIAEMATNRKI